MTFQLDLRSDLFVEQAREGEQDKRRAVSEKGRLTTRAAELVQNLLLSFGNDDLGGLPWHGSFSSQSRKNLHRLDNIRNPGHGWKSSCGGHVLVADMGPSWDSWACCCQEKTGLFYPSLAL